MKTALIAFFGTFVPFMLIDGTFIATAGAAFYRNHISHLMAPAPNFTPAIFFYLIYVIGIVLFVVLPAFKGGQSVGMTFLMGALLGLFAYGTYDLTNQSILKDWPLVITLTDMAWGAFVTGTSSIVALSILRAWN
jgi:uncharacterized membrane protein